MTALNYPIVYESWCIKQDVLDNKARVAHLAMQDHQVQEVRMDNRVHLEAEVELEKQDLQVHQGLKGRKETQVPKVTQCVILL